MHGEDDRSARALVNQLWFGYSLFIKYSRLQQKCRVVEFTFPLYRDFLDIGYRTQINFSIFQKPSIIILFSQLCHAASLQKLFGYRPQKLFLFAFASKIIGGEIHQL